MDSNIFRDDLCALRRLTLEFCSDAAAEGIRYAEVRYCPHLFLSQQKEGETVGLLFLSKIQKI